MDTALEVPQVIVVDEPDLVAEAMRQAEAGLAEINAVHTPPADD